VTGVEVNKGRVMGVVTSAGEVSTRVLFNCAGPWSKVIGEMAGVKVPVEPHKRHIWVTGPVPGVGTDCPMTVDFATTFYFHPEGEGLLFGIGEREDAPTFSTNVDESALERAIEVALRRLPALGQAGVKTGWAGLYEVTPDHQAILGPSREVEGFWCACGFSGHGFMQAPAAGLLLTQRLLDGRSEIDLSPLSPDRFAAGALLAEKNVI
jgi:sarcosine oxidase subunit beta